MYEATETVRSLSPKCENANLSERSFRYDTLGSGCSTIFFRINHLQLLSEEIVAFICKLIAAR